jgi:HEAT repeat protein
MVLPAIVMSAALAAAKGAASAIAGAAGKQAWQKTFGATESKALIGPLSLALVDAIEESRCGENIDSSVWWTKSGRRLLKPFTDRKVAEPVVAVCLVSPRRPEESRDALLVALAHRNAHRSVLDRLLRRDHHTEDFAALANRLGVVSDDFLCLLPRCIRYEIKIDAARPGSPLRDLGQYLVELEIADSLTAGQVEELLPRELKEQLAQFLQAERQWHEKAIAELPYLVGHPHDEGLSWNIPAKVRVGLRTATDIEEPSRTAGIPGPHRLFIRDRLPSLRATETPTETMSFGEAVDRFPRLAVVANPGMGKTWLMHTHAARLAAEAHRQLLAGEVAPDGVVIPIAVRCDTLAARASTTLVDACCELLAERHQLSPGLKAWLKNQLAGGSATYLLDALDEVPHTEYRGLVNMVRTWEGSEAAVGTPMMVTSRIAGYLPLMWSREQVVELSAFSADDVNVYINSRGFDRATEAAVREQLRTPAVAAMARQPLLLAMLCDLGTETAELPVTDTQVFSRILRRFLRAEHRSDTAAARPNDPFDGPPREREQRLLPILRPLAFKFADSDRDRGWIDQMSANQILAELEERREQLPRGADAASALSYLSVTAGVLIPAGDDRAGADPPYLFFHRAIAEYLVAEHLATAAQNLREESIRDHLWCDPEWAPVWPMLGVLLAGNEGLPRYLDYLLQQQPDPVHHSLITAAHVIGHLNPIPASSDVRQTVERVAKRLLALIPTPARPQAIDGLAILLSSVPQDVWSEIDIDMTQHPDIAVRRTAAEALAERPEETATEVLLALACDADTGVRRRAAVALANRPGPTVIDALLALARDDPDRDIQRMATKALANRPEPAALDALLTLTTASDSTVRIGAARALEDRPEPAALDALLAMVRDDDEDNKVRGFAADTLASRPGPALTKALITLSGDADTATRMFAAAVMTDQRQLESAVTEVLLTLARDNDSAVRWAASRGLAYRPEPVVTEALLVLAGDTDEEVRGSAVQGLTGRPGPSVTEALLDPARDKDCSVRRAATQALVDRLEPVVTEALLALASDLDDEVRSSAAQVLADRPGQAVTDALVALASDDTDHKVRNSAAQALANRPESAAVDVLLALARNDADGEIQRIAAQALTGRPESEATEALLAVARDPDSAIQGIAMSALADRPEREATDALLALARDPDAWVRRHAADALERCPDSDVTEVLLGLARDADAWVRLRAAQSLKVRSKQDAIAALITLTQDVNKEVQRGAAASLEDCPGPDVTEALRAGLRRRLRCARDGSGGVEW